MAASALIQRIVILCKFFKRRLLSVVEIRRQQLATEVRVGFQRPPRRIFSAKLALG